MTNEIPLVSVCCITYNHIKYIRQCLDSLLMQKTDFPFEIIINDDCSTDGTADVVREYAKKYQELIIPIFHEENQYSKGEKRILSNCFSLSRGKYIAICEGDDYWTDSNKLQIQYEYMNSHPNCSLCFHAHYNDKAGDLIETHRYDEDNIDCRLCEMMMAGGSYMATNSMFFISHYVKCEFPHWYYMSDAGDLVLMYWLAIKGKVGYINKVMSAYRIASEGSWTLLMAKSWKKRNEFLRKDILLHQEFNIWTEYKYKDIVIMKIDSIKRLKVNENLSQLKSYVKRLLNVS